ncbi:MAG: alpha/beta hydrolase [Gammaproteobacteria bacterium]|nr:alpha/beta hydrolase [Gammaproteobacteria bacterium]
MFLHSIWFRFLARALPVYASHVLARRFVTPPASRPALSSEAKELLEQAECGAVDGVDGKVRYYRWRQGGPRLMLVHGWGKKALDMAPLLTGLLARGYDVTVADMPAHGSSEGRTASFREWIIALRLISRSAGRWNCVIGHGYGAFAAAMAIREDLPQYGAALNTHRLVLLACPDRASDMLGELASSLHAPAETVVRAEALLGQRLRMAIGHFSASRAVRHFKGQLMGVHDAEDTRVPLADFAAIQAGQPLAERLLTTGLGHHGLVSDPQVIESIIDFMEVGQRILVASPYR